MTSAFETDFAETFAIFADVFGETVSFWRGANSVAVTAQRSVVDHKTIDEEGAETIVRGFAFRVTAADLIISGSAIIPRSGDRITVDIGAVTHTFTVLKPPGRGCFEWGDPIRTEYIVYAALTGTS